MLVGGMVFGAIHVTAWDFVFPTLLERKLWWAASVICTATPLLVLMFILAMTNIFGDLPVFIRMSAFIILPMLSILYIIARLFLLVEVFRTLCFLPPSAYVATWAANVPHAG